MARELLSMAGIEKAFGGVPALVQASLSIAPAEIMGLIGQNGAGKSTMIKILNGAHARDTGTITVDGQVWTAGSPQAAQRSGVSTIFQELNLIPFRSVTENICLGREITRFGGLLNWRAMNAGARAVLQRFEVVIDVSRPLGQFSTAIQQMVAIARAVSFEARLVIMDEPTSSLDEAEVAVLLRTVRRLKSEGVSVLFVTHKLDELAQICDRVTVMRDGKTLAVLPTKGTDTLQLVACMPGRDLADVQRSGATSFTAATAIGAGLLAVANVAVGTRVSDASLAIRTGEIVGLTGLLGSGRTETARAVFAADPTSRGAISFDGATTAYTSPRQAIAAGDGILFRRSQGRRDHPRHVSRR